MTGDEFTVSIRPWVQPDFLSSRSLTRSRVDMYSYFDELALRSKRDKKWQSTGLFAILGESREKYMSQEIFIVQVWLSSEGLGTGYKLKVVLIQYIDRNSI